MTGVAYRRKGLFQLSVLGYRLSWWGLRSLKLPVTWHPVRRQQGGRVLRSVSFWFRAGTSLWDSAPDIQGESVHLHRPVKKNSRRQPVGQPNLHTVLHWHSQLSHSRLWPLKLTITSCRVKYLFSAARAPSPGHSTCKVRIPLASRTPRTNRNVYLYNINCKANLEIPFGR